MTPFNQTPNNTTSIAAVTCFLILTPTATVSRICITSY